MLRMSLNPTASRLGSAGWLCQSKTGGLGDQRSGEVSEVRGEAGAGAVIFSESNLIPDKGKSVLRLEIAAS